MNTNLNDCPNGTWKWLYLTVPLPTRVSMLDYHYLSGFSFELDDCGYLRCWAKPHRSKRLHQIIAERMGLPKSDRIDHRDLDKLNNSRTNLRSATYSQNGMNRGLLSNNKSGYTGVYWHERDQRWYVQITVNKETMYLGFCDNLEEAIVLRREAAIKYHGEFAYIE